mmetsp:Transcript_311/g.973  ORF Transcript_311/g.973 Transcript_311/m.973 type:complete len:251 (-) Transcript_311:614-1366(-)
MFLRRLDHDPERGLARVVPECRASPERVCDVLHLKLAAGDARRDCGTNLLQDLSTWMHPELGERPQNVGELLRLCGKRVELALHSREPFAYSCLPRMNPQPREGPDRVCDGLRRERPRAQEMLRRRCERVQHRLSRLTLERPERPEHVGELLRVERRGVALQGSLERLRFGAPQPQPHLHRAPHRVGELLRLSLLHQPPPCPHHHQHPLHEPKIRLCSKRCPCPHEVADILRFEAVELALRLFLHSFHQR